MISIITGSIILSILHAAIPNHWLPVIAIGRREKWSVSEVRRITFYAASAHGLSTILLGVLLSMIGAALSESINSFTHWIGPVILILIGIIFIYRHYHHKHFHIEAPQRKRRTRVKLILALVLAMFLSPCMEIEAYFLLAGGTGWWLVALIAGIYLVISVTGMVILSSLAYNSVLKMNWHSLEHNAGIITGITLVATGILAFFVH